MSLEHFIRTADRLVEFEAAFNDNEFPTTSLHSIETHKDELKYAWANLKNAYDKCLLDIENRSEEEDIDSKNNDLETVKEKYKRAYITYCRVISKLSELIQEMSPKSSVPNISHNHGVNLPTCKIPVFNSEFSNWPTFRDLFTAVCIKNPRLSAIEKLIFLTEKTSGEAFDIVSRCSLTNDGFKTAWTGLCSRFENKRVLVNVQLRKLFSLKPIASESANALKKLQRDINACIINLKQLGIPIDSWDPIFVFLCTDCLPDITLTEWEHTLPDKTAIAEWGDLDAFLTGYHGTLESVELKKSNNSKPSNLKSNNTSKSRSNSGNVKTFQNTITQPKCKLCPKESHAIRKCPRFLNMSVNDKFNEIKNSNLCINCFSGSHSVKNCTSKHSCYKCNKRHNTLLHRDSEPSKTNAQSQQSSSTINSNLRPASTPFQPHSQFNTNLDIQSTSSGNGVVKTYCSIGSRGVLLGTAVVKVHHRGVIYRARALLDSGSEGTLISEKFFNMLKLPYKRTSGKLDGPNNTVTADITKECFFVLGSFTDNNIEISASALVVPRLCGNLPSSTVDISSLNGIQQLELADPRFNESAKIDILLGGDLLPSIMLKGIKHRICGSLMAQHTIFGWVITGPIPVQTSSSFFSCVAMVGKISLDRETSRFWEVEDLPRKNYLSSSDKFCEDLYSRTTTRNSEGRFVVSLPFKDGYPEKLFIGQSRSNSIAQFFRNENRLLRTPDLKNEYDNVLCEYLSLGHMVQVPPPAFSNCPLHYYLPHHAVIKPQSTTTKVRVVFNASSSTSNGLSLNDILHTGPVLQSDLTILILKWRFFRYVFNGDIQQMYRQILVNPNHTAFQRILFRKKPGDLMQDFELKTVTFGVNCAPYLAIRTMIQLAEEVQSEYPLASHILKNSMYVDDALAGAHTIPIAIQARNELTCALQSAGFSMRKWTANSKDILSGLPTDHLLNKDFLEFDNSSSAKTLGICWNALCDSFYFSVTPFPESCQYTKREVLSQISKLFDPAGWLAPCIVLAKILMQRVWIERTDWDEVLSPESLLKWKAFQSNYPSINSIRIPRWVDFTPNSEVQFHGFCDASEKAYAAALYVRINNGTSISTHLIAAKTKVAPIKTLSIPRLELCGAVLLVEMIDSILPRLEVENYTIFCWTDSTIVLSWLAKPPCFWATFVANRVSKISQVIDVSRWHHVSSEYNPADLASRGILPQDMIDNDLWWHGPSWLRESQEKWQHIDTTFPQEFELEKKAIKINFSYFNDFEDILERFSSLPKALRVVSYIYRFYFRTHPNYRHSFYKDSKIITSSEISMVKNKLISICQRAHYPNEYMALSTKKSILSSSPILSLNPFLDAENILRICGRLESSPELSYNERHPVIIPYNCQFSRLLIKFIHQISLHGGNQLVLRLVRTNYWIPRVKNLIKSTINKCKPCILYKHRCQNQLMAALPPERSQISRPFTHTGLDFAGPFDIKNYTGRACLITKGYVCVFVCFSTKAIHVEATSDLSTSAFLAAFSRFVSRRGCPLHLHSDNGTTFVGASRVLAREFIRTSHQAVTSNYAHQNINWHFIPPGAPHMGGLWEAGVKSFKSHLRKFASVSKFTFEEFQTLLSKIEACLNSRPLSPMSQDPSDLAALTPGHFLIGTPILVPIDPSTNEAPMSINNRWQRLKAIHQHFCIRWKNEYLTELHKRHKWKRPEENLKENMLVVIKEDNLPPNSWRLGRISKVYCGIDSRVRVADVLTQKAKAAVKIQAAFRGHKVRTTMKKTETKSTTSSSNNTLASVSAAASAAATEPEPTKAELEAEFDPNDKELCDAALKIQATFRGHLSRKLVTKEEPEDEDIEEITKKVAEELDIDLNDPELNKAATKIQASFRGHKTRKDKEPVE